MRTVSVLIISLVVSLCACDPPKEDQQKAGSKNKAAPSGAVKDSGKPGSPSNPRSCDRIKARSTCVEYSVNNLLIGEKFAQKGCRNLQGTYHKTTCPPKGVIGHCAKKVDKRKRYYYGRGGKPFDIAKAKKDCKLFVMGKFLPAK